MPRPQGITSLAREAHILNTEEAFDNVRRYLINLYLMSDGTINGQSMDIHVFAKSIGVTVEDIRLRMRDNLLESKIWDPEKSKQIVEGMLGQMITWSIEDRMKINSQINVLMRAQGNQYKPFISAELNRALKMGLESSTSFQSAVSKFMGGNTTNIFNLLHQENEVTNNYVTTADVLRIMDEKNNSLGKNDQAKLLETRYDLESLPEVVATKQSGVNIEKEGLGGSIDIKALTSSTDNLKEAMKVADEDHHSMRREIEMQILPESEDPELDIYDESVEIYDDKPNFSAETFLN